jgi:hypothetical protein
MRLVPGGRETCLAYIQRASRNHDPDAAAFWNVFMDLLPIDQDRVDLDDVCEAAGVAPDRIMAVVVSTAMRAGADLADVIAAATYPTTVYQTIKSAHRIGGQFATIAQKDRELVLQHHKFIPTPGRGAIVVNANSNAQAAAAAQSQPSVPSFSDSLTSAISAHRAIQGELAEAQIVEDE